MSKPSSGRRTISADVKPLRPSWDMAATSEAATLPGEMDGHRPQSRLRRHRADAVGTGRIETSPAAVLVGQERQPFAHRQRHVASSGNDGSHVGIGFRRAELRPGQPWAEPPPAEWRISVEHEPSRSEPQHQRQQEGINGQQCGLSGPEGRRNSSVRQRRLERHRNHSRQPSCARFGRV